MKFVLYFFDVSKALDIIPTHALLLAKLHKLNINLYRIDGLESTSQAGHSVFALMVPAPVSFPLCLVLSGMQGSVLGPLLFITYNNDVATCTSRIPESDVNVFLQTNNIFTGGFSII